jgi:hypothetical protein
LQAEPARHPAHRLRDIFERIIARAGQAHNNAITGQLVGPDPLERAEVAHAVGMGGRRQDHGKQQPDRQHEQAQAGLAGGCTGKGDGGHGHDDVPQRLAQKGLMMLKNFDNQPSRLARPIEPLPV